MRLKKVMAITLAAGLTIGSIALAANAPREAGTPSSSATPTDEPLPPIVNPSDPNATAAPTDAPTDKPTDAPTDAPTDKPTDTPTDEPTNTPSDSPTPSDKPEKPTPSKPKKPSLTKKAVKVSGKKITVTVNKVSGAAGYQIKYATKKSFAGAKTKNVAKFSAKTKKVTIKNLKKGTYYVKVRAYKKSGSKKIYGNYSATITAKIK